MAVAHTPFPHEMTWPYEYWAEPLVFDGQQYGAVIHVRNTRTEIETTRRLEWDDFRFYSQSANGLFGLIFGMLEGTFPPEIRNS